MKTLPLRRGRRFVVPLLPFAAIASVASGALAQLPAPKDEPVIGARMPALSPDGKTLAFVWRGDIWVSPASGGRAYSVTDHVELDAYPVFSPDGKWIAFSSLRNGNYDIFVVPTTGGDAKQLTFSGASEVASDWSPDGKTLLFTGSIGIPSTDSAVYSLDVSSLRFDRLTEDYKGLAGAVYSPNGSQIAFQRAGFPWTRPRYNGSGAAQLWTLNLGAGKRTALADDGKQHLWPHYLPNNGGIAVVTVGEVTPNAEFLNKPLPRLQDSAARTPNVWIYPNGGGKPKQITQFVGGSVRCPNIARQTGDMVFEHEHDLYRLPVGATAPVKLSLLCGGESKTNPISRQVYTNSDVEEAEISPDSKTFAFVLKGDLWSIPVEKGKRPNDSDATRLTDYPGFDRDFVWGKDNKTVYFISDRNNNDRLFSLDVASRAVKPIWKGTDDAYNPKMSPDGSAVGFWVRGPVEENGDSGLWVYPTSGTGTPKKIASLPGSIQGEFSWSPDMKWVAYTRRNVESGGFNIWVAPADGTGKAVNVTRLNSTHRMPTWSPDGKYLFFVSNRDGDGLYVLPLKPEDARIEDVTEIKYEKPTGPVTVAIDFTDTAPRVRKLPTSPVPDNDLTFTSDGQILYTTDGDLYQVGYDGKDAKKITSGGGISNMRLSSDNKTAYYYKNGALQSLRLDPQRNYPVTPITFTATLERDVRAERHAAFNQLWRSYNTRFYDGNFHGRDWAGIRQRYEPLLASIDTRDEFATLCNMMIGELEASHSEVSAAGGGPTAPVTRNLGVYFDYDYSGPGIRVKDVPKRAPGSYAKTKINAGEYIVAVDGKDVTLDENLFKVLNDKGDRDFNLLVNSKPSRDGARTVTYRAVSGGEWGDIHYRNRTETLRREVDAKSNGTLAYVHIQGMGGPNQTTFDRELYEYAEGKKGVIIDVRFNGGGNIADQLVNWLNTKPYGTIIPRNGYPIPAPGGFIGGGARSWDKPIVVLINEASFSNAEMFPDAMKATGLAKIVGMPTPGYVIWTGGLPLIDGTSARMPGSGQWRKDGSPLENMGEKPDVMVPLSTEDWMAKRDPQLDKAVEILMK